MSHVTKLILCMIMARTKVKIHQEISDVQYDFVKDSGTRNSIFLLRMLCERSIEMQQKLFLCFIDYTKAFDKVQQSLIKILDSINIDSKDLRPLTSQYWEQKAAVRVADSVSDFVPIKRGVRQGCVLSPDLFSIYSEMIVRNLENMKGCHRWSKFQQPDVC